MCQLCGAGVPDLDSDSLAREIGTWGAASGSFSFALGLGILLNRLSRHWLVRRGHYERALACSRAARTLFEGLGARINAAQCLVDQGLIHQAVGERAIALTLFERALDDYTELGESHPAVAEHLRQRVIFLATDVYQLALQQTDPDGMERAAARLEQQLSWLPPLPVEPGHLAPLLTGLSYERVEGVAAGPDQSDQGMVDSALVALRRMIEDLVGQSGVLAPLYRSRSARAQGREHAAERLLDEATAALTRIPVCERNLLQGTVLAERKAYAEAAEAIRRHLRAGGANAGFAGRLTDLMRAAGGEAGMAQVALQERRSHEQAFAFFVMVRAYADAELHLRALEELAGPEWWRDDLKPWQPLCDMGEV